MRTAFDIAPRALHCLRKSAFLFAGPEVVSTDSLTGISQSSCWDSFGVLPPLSASNCRSISYRWARQDPQIQRYLERLRKCGQPWRPQLLRQVSGSSSYRHPAQSLELNFLFTVPVSTTGPSRLHAVETLRRDFRHVEPDGSPKGPPSRRMGTLTFRVTAESRDGHVSLSFWLRSIPGLKTGSDVRFRM
jgi:hypothetical protein